MIIRSVKTDDLYEIAKISNYYRKATNHIWCRDNQTIETMTVWLAEHSSPPYCAIVADDNGNVAGFASLSQFRPHSGYAKTAEDSIYLSPEYIGKGYGTALMNELIERAKSSGLTEITAWIDSDNLQSVEFHNKFNFIYVGIMNNVGILDGTKRSVIIMQLSL